MRFSRGLRCLSRPRNGGNAQTKRDRDGCSKPDSQRDGQTEPLLLFTLGNKRDHREPRKRSPRERAHGGCEPPRRLGRPRQQRRAYDQSWTRGPQVCKCTHVRAARVHTGKGPGKGEPKTHACAEQPRQNGNGVSHRRLTIELSDRRRQGRSSAPGAFELPSGVERRSGAAVRSTDFVRRQDHRFMPNVK